MFSIACRDNINLSPETNDVTFVSAARALITVREYFIKFQLKFSNRTDIGSSRLTGRKKILRVSSSGEGKRAVREKGSWGGGIYRASLLRRVRTSCRKIRGAEVTGMRNVFSFNFNRETRSGDAPVMCRMRETDNGSVPAECFGPCMACRVRALFRLQSRVARQVLLQGGEALLQERLLQVRGLTYVCVCVCVSAILARKDSSERLYPELIIFGVKSDGIISIIKLNTLICTKTVRYVYNVFLPDVDKSLTTRKKLIDT